MAITEVQRHELYEGLIEVLGREKATTLMEHLPPVGWADVATKRDLDHLAGQLRSEMQIGFAEVRAEFAGLRGEFDNLRGEFTGLRGEFAGLRGEVNTEFAKVRGEIAGVEMRVERALREQTRTYVFAMLTANASLAAVAFAAANLA